MFHDRIDDGYLVELPKGMQLISLVKAMKERRGELVCLARQPVARKPTVHKWAESIRLARGHLSAFEPAGHFETVVVTVFETSVLCVRYVGEEPFVPTLEQRPALPPPAPAGTRLGYAAAQERIRLAAAWYHKAILREQCTEHPDRDRITALRTERAQCMQDRNWVMHGTAEAIDVMAREYGARLNRLAEEDPTRLRPTTH